MAKGINGVLLATAVLLRQLAAMGHPLTHVDLLTGEDDSGGKKKKKKTTKRSPGRDAQAAAARYTALLEGAGVADTNAVPADAVERALLATGGLRWLEAASAGVDRLVCGGNRRALDDEAMSKMAAGGARRVADGDGNVAWVTADQVGDWEASSAKGRVEMVLESAARAVLGAAGARAAPPPLVRSPADALRSNNKERRAKQRVDDDETSPAAVLAAQRAAHDEERGDIEAQISAVLGEIAAVRQERAAVAAA